MPNGDGQIPLNNMQRERFCQEYVLDYNATQAAKRAKYSDRTAYSQGQRLLKFVEVKDRIAGIEAEIKALGHWTIEEWEQRVGDTERRAKVKGDLVAEQRAQDMQGRVLGVFQADKGEDNAEQAKLDTKGVEDTKVLGVMMNVIAIRGIDAVMAALDISHSVALSVPSTPCKARTAKDG